MADTSRNAGRPRAKNRGFNLLRDIAVRGPGPREVLYGHSILTGTLFPETPPSDDVLYVSRRDSNIEYVIEAGIDPVDKTRRYPYGKYPRLIMAWIAKQIRAADGKPTDTVDPEARTVRIPSLYRLMNELGLPMGGNSRSRLQDQLRRLFLCHVSIHRVGGFAGSRVHEVVSVPLADATSFSMDDDESSYATIVLTEAVYERLAHGMPVDIRAVAYLLSGRSVLGYDLYLWLTASTYSLRHPVSFGWDVLYERFGDGMGKYDFRKKFREALGRVVAVYPTLVCSLDVHGLTLRPSPPAVGRR